ncbi:MAG: hypothetical protein JW754_01405 [Candidatus Aenigmarchaeota archaeon]|nr:hypothetical protein [Candidatus Aenigmarchaeota archaeon]
MKRIILALLIAFILPSVAGASEIGMDVSSTPLVWLGDPFQIICNCTPPENFTLTGAVASISGPLVPPDITLSYYDGRYGGSWLPPREGKYSITVTCFAEGSNGTINSSETDESYARKLSLGIVGMTPEEIYTDHSYMTLFANLTQISESLVRITDTNAVEWEIFIGEHNIDPFSVFYDSGNSRWVLNSSLEGIDIHDGTYPLLTKASFEGGSVTLQTDIEIRKALDFEIISVSPEKTIQGENVTVSLSAKYRDSDIFSGSSFVVKVGGYTVSSFVRDDSGKTIRFEFPEIDPGEYGLKITIKNGNIPDTTISRDITCAVPLSGKITNAEGKGMSGKITFIRDGETKITLSSGKYSTRIIPGDYNIIIENMGEIKYAFFSGVYLDGTVGNFFRFDSLSGLVDIEGMKICSAFAMEFDNYFDTIDVQVNYDAKKVRNEQSLEVYTCPEWNFDARICNSEWLKITGGIDDVKNTVTLELNHLSAFMIGEKEELGMEVTLNKGEYYLNEEIRVLGAMRTESGSPIEDAYVTITMDGTDVTEKTNSQGVFSARLVAPSEEGTYEMRIISNVSSVHPIEELITFKTVEKKELSILLPIETEIFQDFDNVLEFSVMNSGQSVLNNAGIEITGMPDGWVSYSPQSWYMIGPGETKKVYVTVNPKEPEKMDYAVEIFVRTDELNESETLPVRISDYEAVREETGPDFTDFFTSNIILDTNDILNTVSIILAFIVLFVAVFRSRKKKPGSFESNPHMERMINGIKKEVLRGRTGHRKKKPGKKSRK